MWVLESKALGITISELNQEESQEERETNTPLDEK
jgi:hypothetical protein